MNWRTAYPNQLSVYAVRAGRPFHTKGYCLTELCSAMIWYTAGDWLANLTNAGLTEAQGNVESLAVHSDIATIKGFLEFFDNEGLIRS